ncbi:MAG: PRC-barrel domain-containing protein [Pseudomonadota bacterium]
MTDLIPWIATALTIVAATMTAANLGSRITGYGFVVFLVGSLAWLSHGLISGQPALTWTNAVLTLLNIFGVWRWLGRQARVEEGAQAAVEASEAAPVETLFPVSQLTSASVRNGTRDLGHCVDAMAGSGSGRIAYLVVSAGGVAGVGETLRRLPWARAEVDDGAVLAKLGPREFDRLEELPRDQWPAR